jgi:hypothetical protein
MPGTVTVAPGKSDTATVTLTGSGDTFFRVDKQVQGSEVKFDPATSGAVELVSRLAEARVLA